MLARFYHLAGHGRFGSDAANGSAASRRVLEMGHAEQRIIRSAVSRIAHPSE